MIRLYMDWNVMSQMKAGNYRRLSEILNNDEQFLKFYSSAHIDDIRSREQRGVNKENIDADLDYISHLTNDCAIYNDGKTIKAEVYDPREMLLNKEWPEHLFDDANIKRLQTDDASYDRFHLPRAELQNRSLAEVFSEAFKYPYTAERMRIFYPGLENDLTFTGLLKATREQFRRLNEEEEYKVWRQQLQTATGINRDRLFDSKAPYTELEKYYKKTGRTPHQAKMEHVPDWYADIINEYILLDMHGYQEDEITVKGRKQTFKNTTNDTFHTAFASTCHFYITNDKKNYKKTKAVYGKLGINTQVFKPEEFVLHYERYLTLSAADHLTIFLKLIQSGQFEFAENEESTMKSFYFELRVFDYFNRAHIFHNKTTEENLIFLSSTPPTNGHWNFTVEFEKLIAKLGALFGGDMDSYGPLNENDDLNQNWRGRRWALDSAIFRLVFHNGWLQLYLDLESNKNDDVLNS